MIPSVSHETIEDDEQSLIPVYNTSLEDWNRRQKPLHIQALCLSKQDSIAETRRKIAMLTSYTGVPAISLKEYVNQTIEIIGAMIYHVDSFVSKADDSRKGGYDAVFLKLSDTTRTAGKERHVIVECYGKQIFELARTIWFDILGWYDWVDEQGESISLRYQVYYNARYYLQEID